MMKPTWDFDAANTINDISNWIAQYIDRAGAKGVVIGLSGGIDSSVVAALAVKRLGKENVLGIVLPCESNPKDKEDAIVVAEWLGIRYQIVDLTSVFDQLTCRSGLPLRSCPKTPTANDAATLTKANIKARLRMTTLYAFANQLNYLNMGTGNRSELMIGYITKYGDGGVDFEPLGEYYKTEVYAMARILDVPQPIIDRKPSAGLWEGQTDEDEIGMSYELLDELLRNWITVQKSHEEPDTIKVNNLINKSKHKRNMPPICPR